MQARNRIPSLLKVVLLLAAMTLPLSGCLSSRPAGNLVIGVLALPSTADPASAANPTLLGLAYETLVARGPDGNFYHGLAKDWGVSADGRTVTLNLKPNTLFSDGTAVTPAAVQASLERLMEKDPAALGPVDKIETSGASAVVLTLSRPYPPLWGALAAPSAAIVAVPQSGLPVGTGPYIIQNLTADAMDLTVNSSYRWAPEYYRVRGPARIATISVKRYPDTQSLAAAVTGNQLDLAGGASIQAPAGWMAASAPGDSLLYLGFYVNRAPANDARVRRAIALLLDKGRTEAAKTMPGWAPTVAFLPGAAIGATETPPSGDPAALLADAGFSRGTDGLYRSGDTVLSLVISVFPRAEDQAAANALIGTLKAAGIDASVKSAASAGDAQAYLARFTWSEPDILYYLLHTGAEANASGYSDANADRLLEAGAGAMNLADRQAVYQALQARLAEDCPWVPLLSSRESWLVRNTTSNIRVGTGGRLYLTTARMK